MMQTTIHVPTWELARQLNRWLATRLFRGQASADWGLQTGLERSLLQHSPDLRAAWAVEQHATRLFQQRASQYLAQPPAVSDLIEWLSLLQHYGGPTRLLDFSRSFYAGAFFAIEQATGAAAVWAVNKFTLLRAGRHYANGEELADITRSERALDDAYSIASRLMLSPTRSLGVLPIEPRRLDARMAAQQGLFLIPLAPTFSFAQNLGHALLGEEDPSDPEVEVSEAMLGDKAAMGPLLSCPVLKIVLPQACHRAAIDDLWNMNINAATLFPGLDGFARSLRRFTRIDQEDTEAPDIEGAIFDHAINRWVQDDVS